MRAMLFGTGAPSPNPKRCGLFSPLSEDLLEV